jgi:hypothetical protein
MIKELIADEANEIIGGVNDSYIHNTETFYLPKVNFKLCLYPIIKIASISDNPSNVPLLPCVKFQ